MSEESAANQEPTTPREPMPGVESQSIPPQYAPDPTLNPPTQAQPAFGQQGHGQQGFGQPGYGQPAPTQPMPPRPDQGYPAPTSYQPIVYGQAAPQQPEFPQSGGGAPGYGAPGYGYGAPVPPKKSRTGLIIGLVIAAIVLCGGAAAAGLALVGDGKSAKNSALSPTETPTDTATSPSASPSAPTTPDHSGDLRRFLVPAPKSSRPWKTPMGSHNTFTAAQESKDWDDSAFRKTMLASHKFDTGAVRQWETSSSLVSVELFRFASADDAKLFTGEETSGDAFFSKPQTEKAITGVDSGHIYYTKKQDSKHNTHAFGVGRCGDVVIEVWMDTYGAVSTDNVAALVRKEYAKLCS